MGLKLLKTVTMGVKHSSPLHRPVDMNCNKSPSPTDSQEDFTRLNKHLKANINGHGSMGLTKLHLASEVGDVTKVVTLLLLGADPNIVTTRASGHVTPLVFAAGNGHTLCTLALLQRGACPNGTDAWGNTALFKAACYNHADCVKALLKYGANPEVPNHWGALPIQYAALQGHEKVVDVLIDAGCDVNCLGERNLPPPLSAAASRAQINVLKRLIKAGADVNLDSNHPYQALNKRTPLYYALYGTGANCSPYDAPHVVAYSGLTESTRETARKDCNFTQCVRTLIEVGAEVHQKCLYALGSNILTSCSLSRLRLAALILRATVYDKTMSGEMKSIMVDICKCPTKHDKRRKELIELMFRVGYTPARKDYSLIKDSFKEEDSEEIISVLNSPRSLANLATLKMRECLQSNPLSSDVKKLELPRILYNEITMDFITETPQSPWVYTINELNILNRI